MFLEQQICILEWFQKDHAENSALITGINNIFKYIKIENRYF